MRHSVQIEVLSELFAQLDRGVCADAGSIRRCPASTYTCPDLLAREWQTFFREHPQIVGMTGDLPTSGCFITSNDFGIPVLVTRDRDGHVRAFLNSCRHRGAMVEQERRGKKPHFACSFHSWTYDLRGRLQNVAEERHFGRIDRACLGLIELPAAERYGFVWVHPDPRGVIDLDVLFEGVADDLAHWGWERYMLGAEQTVDTRFNWKLGTDSFGETYHFKRLHKGTINNNFYGDVFAHRSYQRNQRMILCLKAIDELRRKPKSQWTIANTGYPLYYLFPNVVVSVSHKRIAVTRVYPDPKDPNRSISQFGFYFDPESLAANPTEVQKFPQGFTQVVVSEDFALAETTQRALASGLQREILFGRNELPLQHYHDTFRRALGMEPLQRLDES